MTRMFRVSENSSFDDWPQISEGLFNTRGIRQFICFQDLLIRGMFQVEVNFCHSSWSASQSCLDSESDIPCPAATVGSATCPGG